MEARWEPLDCRGGCTRQAWGAADVGLRVGRRLQGACDEGFGIFPLPERVVPSQRAKRNEQVASSKQELWE